MNDLRRWIRLVESTAPFLDRLQDAVEASEAGFHYEEGGCWGMALALYDAFKALGEHPQLVITSDDGHVLVRVDGRVYDHRGDVTDSYHDVKPTTGSG